MPLQGSETEPSIALGTVIDHRVNERLKFRAGATAFKGFFWNFEDTEFLVVDGEGKPLYSRSDQLLPLSVASNDARPGSV